jgi:uncharacterized Zn finger protein (UPF0148 family)
MAELLRSGHTMLNIACPVCNNPVFRNPAGEKFCPTCNREVRVVNEEADKKTHPEIKRNKEILENDIYNSLKVNIRSKIEWIASELSSETDLELLEKYGRLLLLLLDVLIKLSSVD